MSFVWPVMLWSLVLLPALGLAYLLWIRRRARSQRRHAGLQPTVGPGRGGLRHLPVLLLLLALGLLLVAAARPVAVMTVPTAHRTVLLALDISGSMRATDIKPSRLAATQAAARAFVDAQPADTRIGIVAFAGTAQLVQPPTRKREDVREAIDRLQPQRGTAVGSAIGMALAALIPEAGIDLRALGRPPETGGGGDGTRESRRDAARAGGAARPAAPPVPPGSYDAGVIVLLSDGQSTTGPDPLAAARLAAQHGVRVYTIGIGTARGEVLRTDGRSMRVTLDEGTLKTIADLTMGESFLATDALQLERVYRSLNSRFVMERKELEIGALFAGVAVLFALAGAGLSLAWYGRIV